MAGTWDVPAMLREIPAPLLAGWMSYYAEEPWDAPAMAVRAFGRRRSVDGTDGAAVDALLRRTMGSRRG